VHVKHRLMRYHDFFVDRIGPGERVLDIGCGYGAVAYSVASKAGAIVTGIDLNAENIAKAKHRFPHPNLTFVKGDALKDLPQGMFDVVLLSNILEHLEHRVAFLTAVQGRVKPRRWLIRAPMINRDWRVQ
jgi:2-polyprenyl-3-methyl-5-hydroxy-6-metoxy-1,4-benzoquinol methylase